MSVIIRLQNLAWSATAVDIRQFFRGLAIPEGGVHIVGGEFGDAFIAFSTDEDARQAMSMNGSLLKGSPVKLLLSSRNEMQKVIDQAKQQSLAMQSMAPQPNLVPRLSPESQNRGGAYPGGMAGPNPSYGNAPMGHMGGNYGPAGGPNAMFHPNMQGMRGGPAQSQAGMLHPQAGPQGMMMGPQGHQGPLQPQGGGYYPPQGMDEPDQDRHRDGGRGPGGRDRDRDSKDRHRDHRRGGGPRGHRSRSRSRERDRVRHRSPSPDRRSGRGGRFKESGGEGRVRMMEQNSGMPLPDGLRLSNNVMENLGRGGLLPLPPVQGNNGSYGPQGGPGNFGEGPYRGGRDGDNRDNGNYNRGSSSEPVDEFEMMRRQRRGEEFPEADTSVQVRMLHSDISYKDVREFFRGILIPNSGIKMINNIDGFRFGIAYVKFTREQDKQRALLKNGERHRGQIVNVYHVPDFVFDQAVNSFMPSQNVDLAMFRDSCVAIRDVTPDMQPQDIAHAMRFVAIDDIVIDRNVSQEPNRPWGIAYVRLASRHDANALVREGRKGVRVFDQNLPTAFVPIDEIEKAKQANINVEMRGGGHDMPPHPHDRMAGGPGGPMGGPDMVLSGFVLMKGLLPVVGERDVYDFFSDVGVVPLKVQVLMDQNRLPVGDAICEFANLDDAHRALSKDGTFMGGKTVHVRSISIEGASDILGIQLPNPGLPTRRPSFNGYGDGGDRPPMDGPPHGRGDYYGPPGGGPGGPRQQRGPPMGGGGDVVQVDGFGRPGCVLGITNVPYKAGIKEILQFFDGFDITKESVLRRYNETGQPTGDARIAFPTPEQAERAFHVLQNATIWGRTIKMTLL